MSKINKNKTITKYNQIEKNLENPKMAFILANVMLPLATLQVYNTIDQISEINFSQSAHDFVSKSYNDFLISSHERKLQKLINKLIEINEKYKSALQKSEDLTQLRSK